MIAALKRLWAWIVWWPERDPAMDVERSFRVLSLPVPYRLEVFEGRDGWFWRIRHRNGQKLATSESYVRKSNALKVARRVAAAMGAGVKA